MSIVISYVKKCYKCQWGKQYISTNEDGQFTGESAPLWKNVSPKCFLMQSIFAAIMIAGVVVAYVVEINGLQDNCTVQFKPWIIFQLIVVFFSGIIDAILYTIKYASDERWFRLIFLILGQCIMLALIAGLALFFGLSVLLGLGEKCAYDETAADEAADETAADEPAADEATTANQTADEAAADETTADEGEYILPENIFSKQIWMACFFISCATALIIVNKLILVIWLIKNFYGSTDKFIAIARKPQASAFAD